MITRSKMRRQLYRGGGITGLYPRKKYGIGSDLKDFVRKLIPNEIADVATKAAPFVAPFNPGIAALMRGVGRFDQRGSISDALKQGALTYGGGQLARQLGGAGVQKDFLGTPGDRFTTPLSSDRMEGLRNLFRAREKTDVPVKKSQVKAGDWRENLLHTYSSPVSSEQSTIKNIWNKWQGMSPGMRTAIVGVGSGAIAGVAQWFENQIPQEPGESMEEYIARRKVAVGKLMRQYMDNTRAYDAAWTTMTDEQKDAEVAKYNMNKGGRVGYGLGSMVKKNMPTTTQGLSNRSFNTPTGISMGNTLAENIRRNQAAQQQFSESIAPAQEAVRQRMRGVPEQRTTQAQEPGIFSQIGKTLADKSGYTQHNINNELLKDALKAGKINEQQYKLMGGYDVAQQLPAGVFDVPAVGIASGAYQLAKKGAGLINPDDPLSKYGQYGGAESMDLNMAGAAGLNPTDLQLYGSIINDTYGTGPAIMEREKLANVNEDRRTSAMKLGEGLYNLLNPEAATPTQDNYYAQNESAIRSGMMQQPGETFGDFLARGGDPFAKPTMADVAGPDTSSLIGPENLKNFPGSDKIEVWNPINKSWTSYGYNTEGAAAARQEIAAKLGGEQGRKYLEQYDRNKAIMNQGGRVGLKHGTPEEGIKSLDAGAPDITYEGERPVKKQEMKMAGPDWYIKRIENLMYNFDMSYEEASEIAYDSDKYFEVIGHDPYTKGPVLPNDPTEPINPFAPKPTGPVLPDKMMAAQGGRIGQLYGTGPAGLPGIPRMAPDGMEFDMRQNGGFQGLGAKEGKDDVPAMLAKNEFVFTADAVRGAGGGDIELGAQRMYDTMKNLERRMA